MLPGAIRAHQRDALGSQAGGILVAEVEHGMEHVVDVLQRGNVGRFCHIGVTESENGRAVALVLGLDGICLDELRGPCPPRP